MNSDLTIIYIDALIYILTLTYWIRKKRWNAGILILLIMTISHVGAVFYYSVLSYLGLVVDNIKMEPFVYLFCCIFICIYPLLKNDSIRQIDVRGNVLFTKYLSIFIILITLEPFFENIKILMTQNEEYSDLYEVLRDEDTSVYEYIGFSEIALMFNRWSSYFKLPATVLFFFYLSKKNKPMIIGLGMVLLHYMLLGSSLGQRGLLIIMGLMYLSCFILMSHTYNKTAIKKFLLLSSAACIPFFFFFIFITISRYDAGNSQKTIGQWILLYVSEGPIKFNNEMYYGEHNTNGDVNLCFLKEVFGLDTHTEFMERDQYYYAKNGRRIEVFYTFVGDLISDFGTIGAIIICMFLSILTFNLFHNKNGIIPIDRFMIILFLCHMYCIGFASNVYRAYSLQKGVFIMFLLCLIMFFNRQHFYKKKKNGVI